jgi:hypothetical protein
MIISEFIALPDKKVWPTKIFCLPSFKLNESLFPW